MENEEFSRNKRNIIKNGGLAAGGDEGSPEGFRSRNAVIPTFNISEINLTNDVIKEDEDDDWLLLTLYKYILSSLHFWST